MAELDQVPASGDGHPGGGRLPKALTSLPRRKQNSQKTVSFRCR
jgi:hypothetical protein